MMKSILLAASVLTACAADPEDTSQVESLTCGTDHDTCPCGDTCVPDVEPPDRGPFCITRRGIVFLDEQPKNIDNNDGHVTLCHATGSVTNPYVVISPSVNSCKVGHGAHERDIYPTDGCAD